MRGVGLIVVKMTMNCDYDSAVGVILPVENKILPIVHLILPIEIDKYTPTFFTLFAKNHSGSVFASGKMAAFLILLRLGL